MAVLLCFVAVMLDQIADIVNCLISVGQSFINQGI